MCPFKHIMISIRTFGVQTAPPDPSFFDPRKPPTWPSPNDGYPTITPRPYVPVLDNHDEPTGRYKLEYCQVPEVMPVDYGGRPNNTKGFEVPAASVGQSHDAIRADGRVDLSMAAWYGADVGFVSSLGRWAYAPQPGGISGQSSDNSQGGMLSNGDGRAHPSHESDDYVQQVLSSAMAPLPRVSRQPKAREDADGDGWREGSRESVEERQVLGPKLGVLSTMAPKTNVDHRLPGSLDGVMDPDRDQRSQGLEEWANMPGVESLPPPLVPTSLGPMAPAGITKAMVSGSPSNNSSINSLVGTRHPFSVGRSASAEPLGMNGIMSSPPRSKLV